MADLQYRFGGPIPESAQRMKDRRVARENMQAQRRRTAPPIGVDVLGMPIFPEGAVPEVVRSLASPCADEFLPRSTFRPLP